MSPPRSDAPHLLINPVNPPPVKRPLPLVRDGVCYVTDGTWYGTDIGNKT